MEPVDIDAIKSELELTFTNIYCYFNMLQAISDDNDVDHHRFVKFIQQVEHKQTELINDSTSSLECSNLAIDLAYNLVVTASYINLIFAWESGKLCVGNELIDIAITAAQHMLEFAHETEKKAVEGCVEKLVLVMQKFCLMTVVNQTGSLPNLTIGQKKVLSRIKRVMQSLDEDKSSTSSTNSYDSLEDDEGIVEAIQKAKIFGQQVYKDAVSHTKVTESEEANENNNADNPELCAAHTADDSTAAECLDTESAEGKSADMDDLLLFTKCSPFADVWRLYADNPDLVALFKIEDCHREECLKQLPNSFTMLCNLEALSHSVVCSCIANEADQSNECFHILQSLVSRQSLNADEITVLQQIVGSFQDVEDRISKLFDVCEEEMVKVMSDLEHNSISPEESERNPTLA
ncbi:hypothetical protein EB796_019645 [Bugula neritina]|uniref:SWIM-type domain-containing protein n=1 Tax=Bugula neritina TaxID=10212 RepID=A0A7J7J7G7_BUGNE|nr:hypothetical protein EB796_019645 [Bugula neritina]